MGDRVTAILWLLAGCASELSSAAPQGGSADSPNDLAEPAAPPTASETTLDSGESLIPSVGYYALNLAFELVGGTDLATGDLEYPLLAVDLYSDDGELSIVCKHDVAVLDVVPEAVPDTQPPLAAWWRLELDVGVTLDPCPEWTARIWWIGLGPYDPRLDPMMAERGSLGFDVYGLYLQESSPGPVYVVGMAGTNAMISGEVGLTVGPDTPLADGQYQAQSLLLMSFDDG